MNSLLLALTFLQCVVRALVSGSALGRGLVAPLCLTSGLTALGSMAVQVSMHIKERGASQRHG